MEETRIPVLARVAPSATAASLTATVAAAADVAALAAAVLYLSGAASAVGAGVAARTPLPINSEVLWPRGPEESSHLPTPRFDSNLEYHFFVTLVAWPNTA